MSTSDDDSRIAEYLRRLDVDMATLPRERREELRAEIEQHTEEARTAGREVRDVLDRLDQPEEIAAHLLLGVGGFVLPLAPWVAGTVLAWRSRCWTSRQKWRGVYVPLVAAAVAGALVLAPARHRDVPRDPAGPPAPPDGVGDLRRRGSA